MSQMSWGMLIYTVCTQWPPPPLSTLYCSVGELCLGGYRLTAPAWAKLQAHIISFLSLSFLSLQASGPTLSHCNITPFRHGSHHPIAGVRGLDGGWGWRGLGAETEHSVPVKCSTGSLLVSTNGLLNGWWDHTVWRLWLASGSVRRCAGRSSNGHCLMMRFFFFFGHMGRTEYFFKRLAAHRYKHMFHFFYAVDMQLHFSQAGVLDWFQAFCIWLLSVSYLIRKVWTDRMCSIIWVTNNHETRNLSISVMVACKTYK